MLTRTLTFILSLLSVGVQAQVTFRLTAVPADTPAGATIYLTGSFNNWNPASATHALARATDGTYAITLPASTGTVQYKFTRGSWDMVETTANNGDVANRSFTFGAAPATVEQQVLNWKDLAGGGPDTPQSTATANVQMMSAAFAMPQLGGRTRRVWLYLPTGYATASRRYPVMYLQDGQNMFDAATSFSGEWGVDETLSQLQATGVDVASCIVVGIDNGGSARLNEYSPWRNPQYGGGEGDQYLEFLVQTLKPYIDANYRTQPDRASTGIGGSSMGSLIATYAALKYPAVFGKVAAFSPAYWFSQTALFDYVRLHPANPNTRFYFVSGTTESETMVPLMMAMRDALRAGGVPAANLNYNTRPDGQHAEWFWKREYEVAHRWLFAPATSTSTRKRRGSLGLEVYPNPASTSLRIKLPTGSTSGLLRVRDMSGRLVLQTTVGAGASALDVRGLQTGGYSAQLQVGDVTDWQVFSKE